MVSGDLMKPDFHFLAELMWTDMICITYSIWREQQIPEYFREIFLVPEKCTVNWLWMIMSPKVKSTTYPFLCWCWTLKSIFLLCFWSVFVFLYSWRNCQSFIDSELCYAWILRLSILHLFAVKCWFQASKSISLNISFSFGFMRQQLPCVCVVLWVHVPEVHEHVIWIGMVLWFYFWTSISIFSL